MIGNGSTHSNFPVRYRNNSLSFLLIVCSATVHGQVTVGNGDHVLEISGAISTYYNQRFLKPGELDHKKDRFALRDAQVVLEGRYRQAFGYQLQFDLADLTSAAAGVIDPENPGLMDAYVSCALGSVFDVKVGYQKLPYGRSSQVPFFSTPYWQRAEVVRGDLFSRRDVGVTLSSSFWKQRAATYLGVYTGLGETSLRGDNDASGRPEVVGRVEVAWPSRYRKVDVDDRISPQPMVAVGANARYMDKGQPAGAFLPAFAAGEHGLKVIDGSRTAIGADVSAQYKGFSAQFETHALRYEPRNGMSALFQGTDAAQHEGYVMAGGYYGQVNWYHRGSRSTVSVRYEEMDLNDLAPGRLKRIGGAIGVQLNAPGAMVKAQFWHVLEEEAAIDPLRWTEQVRVGLQYQFK